MASPVFVLLLLVCSVQLSSSIQVPEESVQELYRVASSYSECANIYWKKLRYARGIVLVVRSACRKDEDTYRSAINNLQCSDITTAVSRYCSGRYIRFWATNLVCRFARKVNERCEESDDRSPLCKLAISRMPRRWASITCERYDSYCKSSSSRLRYFFRFMCRLTEQFYSQCCGDDPMTEPTTTPKPATATTTTEVPTTEPPTTTSPTTEVPLTETTEVPTTQPTTTPEPTTTTTEVPTTELTTEPATTTPGSTLPEVAGTTFLTACQQQCVRNDLVGSLCTQGTLPESCNNLEPPATDGSYTCCQG
ncbi:uncharacterized protein [Haliotis asinina]|uniref:uncharacterized protein n=1 Tax=Haliotis asinina TaxID=109174 RepID=UPI003532534B